MSRISKKEVKTETLIQKRIKDIDTLLTFIENHDQNYSRLKAERKKLQKLLKEIEPLYTRVNENKALLNDYSINIPGLEYQNSFASKYNIYKTKSGKQFILRFLHPRPAEAATGVDLVY
jgi:hypothetical protein